MHILRVANFVSPSSGGIKTALHHWGEGYLARGHRATLIIPGPGDVVSHEDQGTVYRVPATPIPHTGYSLMWSRVRMSRLLEAIKPDVLEISDRATTRWMGRWAARRGIPSMMISHENMTGIMVRRTPVPNRAAVWCADWFNLLSSHDYDLIVCPSTFAAEEFYKLGIPAEVVPLGVDLDVFHPTAEHRDLAPDGTGRRTGRIHIVHCGRLAPEKNPALSIETLRELVRRGVDAHLTVLGQGPLRDEMLELAQDLPITFHAYIHGREELAAVMARADVAIAPGPVETFGLAALEVQACGVPTVCPVEGALKEVVGDAGVVAESTPQAFADGVLDLLGRAGAREQARRQAERFSWEHSTERMLELHTHQLEQVGRR